MNPDQKSLPSSSFLVERSRFLVALVFFGLVIILSGCAQTQALKAKSAMTERINPAVVLLIEPDVQLSVVTASGLQEPNAEWTEIGRRNVAQALEALLKEKNASLIAYRAPQNDLDRAHRHNQIMKMHGAVGVSILNHKYNEMLALPTKVDRFDWTLGPDTQMLRDEFGADYALFVFMRDSYASAGRVAVIAVAALLGVGMQGGMQLGFASLVDLQTGEVVWFNRLISGAGDLRTPEPARQAIDSLLTDAPL